MRRANARRLVAAAVLAACPASADAAITASFTPVSIPQAAINQDPQLAGMQSWDIMVTTDGDWASAGMRATLPPGQNFYNHAFGSNTRPNPALVGAFPALAFDTYVTSPGDTGSSGAPAILGGFPEGQPVSMSGNHLSVSWGDLTPDAPGTYPITRLTFPQGVVPFIDPLSNTSQVNPDSSTSLNPMGPFFAHWVTNADGSWHDGANWNTGSPPNGNYIVTVDVGGATVRTVTYSQNATTVQSITTHEHLVLSGGVLSTFAGWGITAHNGITINGGTLRGEVYQTAATVGPAGGRVESHGGFLGGLVMPGGAPLVVDVPSFRMGGNSTFSPGAVMRMTGSATILLHGSSAANPGNVHFNGGGAIQVDGGRTLVIGALMDLRGSGGTIAAPAPGSTGIVMVENHGRITADVPGGSLTVAGAPAVLDNHGTLNASAGAVLNVVASTTLRGGATGGDGAVRVTGALNVAGHVIKPGAGALRVGNARLTVVPGSSLDVLGGSVINDYTGSSTLGELRDRIISGYNNGSWNGTGIRSATAAGDPNLALGYAEAGAIFASFPATFMGESVDATTVLIRLTRAGDADLNGLVNLTDFNRLAAGFGSTGALWDDGDFNYDGNVNLDDFNLLAANFGRSAAGTDVSPADWAALAAAVPEPGAAAGAILTCILTTRRRRRG